MTKRGNLSLPQLAERYHIRSIFGGSIIRRVRAASAICVPSPTASAAMSSISSIKGQPASTWAEKTLLSIGVTCCSSTLSNPSTAISPPKWRAKDCCSKTRCTNGSSNSEAAMSPYRTWENRLPFCSILTKASWQS